MVDDAEPWVLSRLEGAAAGALAAGSHPRADSMLSQALVRSDLVEDDVTRDDVLSDVLFEQPSERWRSSEPKLAMIVGQAWLRSQHVHAGLSTIASLDGQLAVQFLTPTLAT